MMVLRSAMSRVWWDRLTAPVLGKLRQEDCEFKDGLGYRSGPMIKEQHKDHPHPLFVLLNLWLTLGLRESSPIFTGFFPPSLLVPKHQLHLSTLEDLGLSSFHICVPMTYGPFSVPFLGSSRQSGRLCLVPGYPLGDKHGCSFLSCLGLWMLLGGQS